MVGAVGASVLAATIAVIAVACAFWWTPIVDDTSNASSASSVLRPKYYIPTKQVRREGSPGKDD